jgi:ATP-dependent Clp protease ATP-binding subunit ClpC
MTSNVGARHLTEKKQSLGFSESDISNDEQKTKDIVLNELKSAFKPEFLNRVDDIIVFKKLTKDEIAEIAQKMLKTLSNRLKELEIEIEFHKSVVDELAESGFDAVYGARPLRRAIQSRVEDVLSEKILDGSIVKNSKVLCLLENNEFVFKNAD